MDTCRRPLLKDVGDGAERVCRALHQDLSREGWVNGVVLKLAGRRMLVRHGRREAPIRQGGGAVEHGY